MNKQILTRSILLALAMSTAAGGTSMAISPIEGSYESGQMNGEIEVTNDNPERAAIKLENQDKVNVVLETGPDAYDITLESAGSGIHTTDGSGNISLDSSANNEIHFNEGKGIYIEDDTNAALTAAADNIISRGEATLTGEEDYDGINVGGSGEIFLTGANNTITLQGKGSDGIYTVKDSEKDVTLTATTGSNSFLVGNNGIDHRGNGTVTLTAEKGSNSITTTNGDGVRVDGSGSVVLHASENSISAGDNGLQLNGGGSIGLIGQNTTIAGNKAGIDAVNGTITIDDNLIQDDAPTTGSIVDIKKVSDSTGYGIYLHGENIMSGTSQTDGNANVSITADTVNISAAGQSSGSFPTVAGVYLEGNEGSLNVNAGNGGLSISGFAAPIEGAANPPTAFGIVSHDFNESSFTSTGDITIESTISDGKGTATGIDLKSTDRGNYISLSGKNVSITASTNDGAAFGIDSAILDSAKGIYENSVAITAEENINITTQSNDMSGAGITTAGTTVSLMAGSGSTCIEVNGTQYNSGIWVSQKEKNGETAKGVVTLTSAQDNTITSSGSAIQAVTANSEANVTAQNGSNTMNSIGTTLYANLGGIIDLQANNGKNQISSNGTAVYSLNGSHIVLGAGYNQVDAGTYGLYASSDNSEITLNGTNGNRITSTGSSGIGITASGADSVVNVISSLDNNTVDTQNRGILASAAGSVALTADTGSNSVTAKDSYAVFASGSGSSVTMNAGTNNVIQAGDIETVADFGTSYGINALSGGKVTLKADNQNAVSGAIYARGAENMLTQVKLNGFSNVVQSAAVITDAGDLDDTSKSVFSALYAEDGASITVDGSHNEFHTLADPNNTNQLERTIWAYNGADITVNGESTISTNQYEISPNSLDVAIAAGTATGLEELGVEAIKNFKGDRATVTLNYDGDSYITGDILAAYAGQVNIKTNAANTLAAGTTPSLHVQGNLLAGNNGVLNVDLGNGGTLTGRADDYGDASTEHTVFFNPAFSSTILSGGEVSLNIGNGSLWNVTGQSWITNLTGEGGIVNMTGVGEDSSHAVHIKNLAGNHTFVMDVNHADHTNSDMLYVDQTAEGSTQTVQFVNMENLVGMANGEKLRFATVNANVDQLQFVSGDTGTARTYARDIGINDLGLDIRHEDYEAGDTEENVGYNGESFGEDKAGNATINESYENGLNWYLVRNESADQISDAGKTVIAMSKVNYSNAVYMDRLNKRMGEARYIDGDDGLWVRLRHDRIGKDDAFRSMNTMFELGYDWHAKGQKDGEHRQGVAFDYMRGTADYKNVAGDGDVRRAGVWLYDTWLGDKGHYSDYVVKYGRLSNDFDIYGRTTGEKISGDYDNDVWSVSAEYGRKKDIGNDWYFEPQVQAQYAYVTSADYTTSQGTKVSLDSIDSLIGRAGFRLGRDTSEGNTVYFKADILHEFLGDQSIRAMDATGTLSTTYENEGTWYDVGFGFAHKMGKDSYVFLDVEHSFGNDNDDTYQINIGLNHAF